MQTTTAPLVDTFEQCASYSIISILLANTVASMRRFRGIPQDELMTKVYSTIKDRAAGSTPK